MQETASRSQQLRDITSSSLLYPCSMLLLRDGSSMLSSPTSYILRVEVSQLTRAPRLNDTKFYEPSSSIPLPCTPVEFE